MAGSDTYAAGWLDRARTPTPSQRLAHFFDLHCLDQVALFCGREAVEHDTAVEAFLHLARIVLEALEARDLPGPHQLALAQHPRARVAAHEALGDHAARDDVCL